MGSYLKIDGRETNSKTYSGILIDTIRGFDISLKTQLPRNKEVNNLFTPERYEERDGEMLGRGNWKIKMKGIALMVASLNEMLYDNELLVSLAIENNSYFFENLVKEEEIEEKLKEKVDDARECIEWCIRYTSNILANMILFDKEEVEAIWI